MEEDNSFFPYKALDATSGRTTLTRRNRIDEMKSPKIVFYGDSHIGRLLLWKLDLDNTQFMNDLEDKVLRESRFIYSGGSRWLNIHQRVQGKGVPPHQKQGNSWERVIEDIHKGNYSPEYLFMSCSGNDLCQINDIYFDRLRQSPEWHLIAHSNYGPSDYYRQKHNFWFDDRIPAPKHTVSFDQSNFIEAEFEKLQGYIDDVMCILNETFVCKKYILGTLYRQHWFPAVSNMVTRLNTLFRLRYKVKVCQINGYITTREMDPDGVHLSKEGYRLFISKGLGPLLDMHIKNTCKRKPKIALADLPKNVRKKIYRKMRKQRKLARANDKM